MRLSPLLLALALAGVSGAAPAETPKFRRFASGEASRFANSWWIVTSRGTVLVDAPFLLSEAKGLGAEMTSASGAPLGAAILTSSWPERSWGLTALLGPATRVWGTKATATALEKDFARERERLLRAGVPHDGLPRSAPRVTNTFSGSLSLGFEGYTLRLFEAGEEGSPLSTAVFVPETGELFAGGLVWNRVHPVTGGADLGAWRRTLASLKRLGPKAVYPGHGEPGSVRLLDDMSAYLAAVEEAVRPLAARSALSARDLSSLRRGFARSFKEWVLPEVLDETFRGEHARLRRLLAGGD